RVHGRRMDGVAGLNRKDRLVFWREAPVENRRRKFVPPRRAALARRNQSRGKRARFRMSRIVAPDKNYGPGNRTALYPGLNVFAAAMIIFREKLDGRALHGSFELVPVEVAGELVALLFKLQLEIERRAVKIGGNGPAPA